MTDQQLLAPSTAPLNIYGYSSHRPRSRNAGTGRSHHKNCRKAVPLDQRVEIEKVNAYPGGKPEQILLYLLVSSPRKP